MTIRNLTRNTPIADRATAANTPFKRMTGLLDRRSLGPGEALVIAPCQSIHMLFMKFAIDVIFVDRQGKVVGVRPNIRPFRFSPLFLKAHSAIEVPAGTITSSQTHIGDSVQIS